MANWSSNLITTMTSNTTPSPFVASASSENSTNFSAWKSFNNSVVDGWSSVSSPTYPQWIQYKFDVAKKVNKIVLELSSNFSSYPNRMLKDFDIIASNTGSFSGEETLLATISNQTDWSVASPREFTFNNENHYVFYRIKIKSNNGEPIVTSGDIQMFESYPLNKFLISSNDDILSFEKGETSSINAIPTMTSDTTPSGEASATNSNSNAYAPWKAFDNDDVTLWYSSNNIFPLTLSYKFDTFKTIGSYSIRVSLATEAPKSWKFQGTVDDVNWIDLDARENVSLQNNTDYSFECSSIGSFIKYRLYITANGGGSQVRVNSLKMFETTPSKLRIVPSSSENNFIKYGVNKSTIIDLNSQMSNKVFIEQNSNTLGNGKVFSKSIDTTKTPIKKITIK